MTLSNQRSVRVSIASAVAALATLVSAASADANPGNAYVTGPGRCQQELNMTLSILSPSITVYGFPTTDSAQVWHRLVDDYGRPQTNWASLGMLRATATAPAVFRGPLANRGVLKQYSRMQYYVAWYAIFGRSGTHPATHTAMMTLSDYLLYSFGGVWFQLQYTGRSTACFG